MNPDGRMIISGSIANEDAAFGYKWDYQLTTNNMVESQMARALLSSSTTNSFQLLVKGDEDEITTPIKKGATYGFKIEAYAYP